MTSLAGISSAAQAEVFEQTIRVPVNAVTSIDSSFGLFQATFDVQGDFLVPTVDSSQFNVRSVSAKLDAWGATLQWYDFRFEDAPNAQFSWQSQITAGAGGAPFPRAAGSTSVNTGFQDARIFAHVLPRDTYDVPAGTLGSAVATEATNFLDAGSEGDGTTRVFWRETIVVNDLGLGRQANRILILANLGLEFTYELEPLTAGATALASAFAAGVQGIQTPEVFMVADGETAAEIPDDLLAQLPDYVIEVIPEPGSFLTLSLAAMIGLLARHGRQKT
ncbi:MAG: hypothetical protein AAF593_08705 [Planctomycetota bacterium]